jgi:hypothetical protein
MLTKTGAGVEDSCARTARQVYPDVLARHYALFVRQHLILLRAQWRGDRRYF